MWWPETGSNRRRRPFQGRALPLSYLALALKCRRVRQERPSECVSIFACRGWRGNGPRTRAFENVVSQYSNLYCLRQAWLLIARDRGMLERSFKER
jgi:hypothetical protein